MVLNKLHPRSPGSSSKLSILITSVIDNKGKGWFPDQGSEDLTLKYQFWKVCELNAEKWLPKWGWWSLIPCVWVIWVPPSNTALPSWGSRDWLQMGGDWGPLAGKFVIEWDYINAELRRSKNQVFSPKSNQGPLANQHFQDTDWALHRPQSTGFRNCPDWHSSFQNHFQGLI